MADEAAEYWRVFEEETGERVQARCMGQYFEPEGDERGLWGLVILTDRSFRFKHMPSDNWIMSLFKTAGRAPRASKAVDLVVPREDLISLSEPPRSFLSKILGPAYADITITWRDAEGEKIGRFSVDPSGDFLAAFRKAVSPAPGR